MTVKHICGVILISIPFLILSLHIINKIGLKYFTFMVISTAAVTAFILLGVFLLTS